MDTTSNSVNRRSFLGLGAKLAAGAAGAVVLANVAGNSASAENASVKEIGHTLVYHPNGVWTLGVVSAFTIDTATHREIDESTRSVRDTGMIVELPAELNSR